MVKILIFLTHPRFIVRSPRR